MAKNMAQQMVHDILSWRGNVSPPPRSPRGDEERCIMQEKQAYMNAFIHHEAKKRAYEIACQKLNDILFLGGGSGSPPPSPPPRVTRHMLPSKSPKGIGGNHLLLLDVSKAKCLLQGIHNNILNLLHMVLVWIMIY